MTNFYIYGMVYFICRAYSCYNTTRTGGSYVLDSVPGSRGFGRCSAVSTAVTAGRGRPLSCRPHGGSRSLRGHVAWHCSHGTKGRRDRGRSRDLSRGSSFARGHRGLRFCKTAMATSLDRHVPSLDCRHHRVHADRLAVSVGDADDSRHLGFRRTDRDRRRDVPGCVQAG